MTNSLPVRVVKVHADGTADVVLDCRGHVDMSLWIETGQPDSYGNMRVICKLCNKFIGYRPPHSAAAEPKLPDPKPQSQGNKHGTRKSRR